MSDLSVVGAAVEYPPVPPPDPMFVFYEALWQLLTGLGIDGMVAAQLIQRLIDGR